MVKNATTELCLKKKHKKREMITQLFSEEKNEGQICENKESDEVE